MQDPLIPQIRFVPFMTDITDQVRPRNAIRRSDEPRVGDGAEGLAHVAGVGDVPVGGEEDCTKTGGIGSISDGRVGGLGGTEAKSRCQT